MKYNCLKGTWISRRKVLINNKELTIIAYCFIRKPMEYSNKEYFFEISELSDTYVIIKDYVEI
jgi:Fe-S cluster biosynthesis and repair protein YggX